MDELIHGAEVVSLFCRLNVNAKRDLPVRSSEMGLLFLLVNSAQPVTPAMAADFFKVGRPAVTAMVKSLETKGYLARSPMEGDARSCALTPMPMAFALVADAQGEYHRNMRLLQRNMGETKYGKLIALLERANQIMLEDRKNG